MTLLKVLAEQVPSRARSRGSLYFRTNAVRSVTVEGAVIHAVVNGTDSYDVWFEVTPGALLTSCTCPYFLDRLDPCKHIWAAILAASEKQIPLVHPSNRPDDVALEPVLPDDDGVLEFDEPPVPGAPVSTWSPRRPAPRARPRPAPPESWKKVLDVLSAPPPAPPPYVHAPLPESLLYVVDPAASLRDGALSLELMTRDRKKNGEWGKPRSAVVSTEALRTMRADADREILERLLGVRSDGGFGLATAYGLARFRLVGALATEALPRLCATGRCMLRPHDPSSPLLPLAWDAGPPWRFLVRITRDPATGHDQVDGALVRDGDRLAPSAPLLVLADGILLTGTHAARLDHGGGFSWLAALRQSGPLVVPPSGRRQLLDALYAHRPAFEEVPVDLRVEIAPGMPRPRLRLTPARHDPHRLEADLLFGYGETYIPAIDPAPLVRVDDTHAIERDRDAERSLASRLTSLGFRTEWNGWENRQSLQIAAGGLSRAVSPLLAEGWRVEAGGRAWRPAGAVNVAVTSGIDWFDLEGYVQYDEGQRASLPDLLAAAQRGERFVSLGDGTLGLLPEEWLGRHGLIARMGAVAGDRVRFSRSQVGLLDALLAAQPEATCDELFARARRELQAFDGISPIDPPDTFTGTLRPYQREGLGWLVFLQRFGFGGCLADDMGLGKTIQVLALLALRRAAVRKKDRRPSLVVAPRSLVFNWRDEAARFTPSLRVMDYTGAGRTGLRETFADTDLVLTTYGTLRRDAAHLAEVRFEYVVLDEAQAVKNASSASARAVRLLKADHRLALSGTPVENHLGELWSLFDFLNPGLLGASAAFAAAGSRRDPDPETSAALARGLKPFILRRTKAQVAPELPPRSEQTIYCELEKPQRAAYDDLRDHYRRALLGRVDRVGLKRSALQVLEALLRLRQAACHSALIDARRRKDGSAKLDTLVAQLESLIDEGHKALVFSQFTSFLALLCDRLDAKGVTYEYLDGQTTDRQRRVERFQQDASCPLFLISLKAGGVGLNLTAADYVFLLDPWWNPAVEAQAIDRAHRIGQERHVLAYRLIAKDTVEERVLELQQRKRHLADAILAGDGAPIRDLRPEDLDLLLS